MKENEQLSVQVLQRCALHIIKRDRPPKSIAKPLHTFFMTIMQKIKWLGAVLAFPSLAYAQTDTTHTDTTLTLDGIEVQATRASERAPMSHHTISKEELSKNNVGVDLPYLLDQTPSVVVTSDAGAGVGYTGIRVRGSDATRINVTINGIPINDAESQGVFWVNMPDLATSTEDIQIQRGVGASTNGGSAFGATINIRTNSIKAAPYGEVANTYGSFQSRRHSISFGTGIFNRYWILEGRLSHILSNGYIDRASSNLKSYSFTGTFVRGNTLIRFNTFAGHERTYQAWGGVPINYIDTNRTYNPYTYANEVDNYQQTHYQLHANHSFSNRLTANIALHYTKGGGYYEQYKTGEKFSKYGLENVVIGNDTITKTDLIRRRWLDNDFYGLVYSVNYTARRLNITLGGGWNNYTGAHFGEVIWAKYASNSTNTYRYYDNNASKLDGNTFVKLQYQPTEQLYLYADMQHRLVRYEFLGYNNRRENVTQQAQLHFFNPKLGATYQLDKRQNVFASLAVGNREPNRDDYTQSTPASRPKAEQLYDVEAGYQLRAKQWTLQANAYYMYYINQLILTGAINDVGAYIRANVPRSYRTGIELQGVWQPTPRLRWSANATWSQNKIVQLTEYVDVWDDDTQAQFKHQNTDIAFAPNIIAGSELAYTLIDRTSSHHTRQLLNAAWISKYVGKQYLDNTQSSERMLAGYWVNDLRLAYSLRNLVCKDISLTLMLRNFLNARYSSNGFVYRYQSAGYDPRPDDPYTQASAQTGYYNQIGLYPQAGINFFVGLTIKF